MNILYLAHRIPYPPDKGDKIRSYHMLRHLAERHDIWCAFFVDDPKDMRHVEELKGICREVIAVPLNTRIAKLRALLDLAIDETATEGFYRDRTMRTALIELSRRVTFDALLVYSSSMGQYARLISARRKVIDLCDLDSRKWAQIASRKQIPFSWLYRAEAERLDALERRLYARFDDTIVIGSHEVADWTGPDRSEFRYVANGVRVRPRAVSPTVDTSLVGFVGDMAYYPNQDAVDWFVRSVWPAVRTVAPAARFQIVGRRPPNSIRNLAAVDGVEVVGEVPDVADYLDRFSVVVAPLRIARGIQNKVLEAMAAGKPVVATPEAAAGIKAVNNESILIAGDADSLAAQVNRIIRDPALGKRIGQQALAVTESLYTWERQLKPLEAILAGTAANMAAVPDSPSMDAVHLEIPVCT